MRASPTSDVPGPGVRRHVAVLGDHCLIVRERDVHAVASTRRENATGLYL